MWVQQAAWVAKSPSASRSRPPIRSLVSIMLARFAKQAVGSLGVRVGATAFVAESSPALQVLAARGYAKGECTHRGEGRYRAQRALAQRRWEDYLRNGLQAPRRPARAPGRCRERRCSRGGQCAAASGRGSRPSAAAAAAAQRAAVVPGSQLRALVLRPCCPQW